VNKAIVIAVIARATGFIEMATPIAVYAGDLCRAHCVSRARADEVILLLQACPLVKMTHRIGVDYVMWTWRTDR
jgi:hypothetical protein